MHMLRPVVADIDVALPVDPRGAGPLAVVVHARGGRVVVVLAVGARHGVVVGALVGVARHGVDARGRGDLARGVEAVGGRVVGGEVDRVVAACIGALVAALVAHFGSGGVWYWLL